MKKLLALCLSALVLVGCASNTETTTETSAPATTETTVETTAPATTEATEETTAPETTEATEEVAASYTAGTYTSTVDGHNDKVTVEVTFTDSAIETITVTEHAETAGLGDTAMETVIASIIENQSLEVDTVSGATVSSEALISAVQDCINQATAK
ncbi:MAG: FMN-binding protein [Erysipelotrichaceae bacterium]|nr:FMN-binding protein [Erysipelotrichaceae bacterium]MDY5251200.1 FMN-binding protein [Erysipelotrichaceae bacterium]